MPNQNFLEKQEDNLAVHIFTVSAGMVGVCITVIGIINIITSAKKIATLIDDITAINAVIFLLACIISYIAIKTRGKQLRLLLEKIADGIFISGLILMVIICFSIVYMK